MHIVVLDDYQRLASRMGRWSRLGPDTTVEAIGEHVEGPDLVAVLRGADVVVAMRERTAITRQLFEQLPRLRLVVTTGMVNQVIDFVAAADHGVTVCGTGGLVLPTAELTWGLIIGLLRHIPAEDAAVRAGGWQHTLGTGLNGRTLGVVGLGRLGASVARVGQAFDMDVQAWSPNLTAEKCAEHGVRPATKAALFATSHVVTVHMVLGPATRGLVGRTEIGSMRRDAVLVNTSRGPLVDQDALAEALREERIAGAALDVFEREPLPAADVFRSLPNTVVTPHIGYVTDETMQVFYDDIVEDIRAFRAGAPIRVMTSG
ncbi:2-hydroxyacid dehydrogenase [Pseudonocardia sulfidoxydans NBRC 16205]|uniref:2-hydroxyacid dehydrogenase n=1 Tax=Pseudonocardia sulfidoxydans NBRC 16205 TaxID=1223511 RepID=A0A511D8W5_9PSEU|nr:D-2-hydroxyacid dehydrogenase family protein [Pseudonocardia sulfidoxydans]GEL21226.1 2-hydroxyacid dehydrogenase [Pseudonocardia sulfidoxydans NBRC 16205]